MDYRNRIHRCYLEVLSDGLWNAYGLEAPLGRAGQCGAALGPFHAHILLVRHKGS